VELKRHGRLLKSAPRNTEVFENVNLIYPIPDASPRKEKKVPRISATNRWKKFEDFRCAPA
jgi:hypothetical protein